MGQPITAGTLRARLHPIFYLLLVSHGALVISSLLLTCIRFSFALVMFRVLVFLFVTVLITFTGVLLVGVFVFIPFSRRLLHFHFQRPDQPATLRLFLVWQTVRALRDDLFSHFKSGDDLRLLICAQTGLHIAALGAAVCIHHHDFSFVSV